jgi:hypothetical protein
MLLAQAAAAASSPAAEPNQHFFVLGQVENPKANLFGVGPVSGLGTLTAQSVTFNEPTRSYDETDVIAVEAGTLTIAVHGAFSRWPFALAPPLCTQHGTMSGTWTITSGTRAFAGATGGGTLSGAFFTFGPRTPAGCDTNAVKGVVAGPMRGTVTLAR